MNVHSPQWGSFTSEGWVSGVEGGGGPRESDMRGAHGREGQEHIKLSPFSFISSPDG